MKTLKFVLFAFLLISLVSNAYSQKNIKECQTVQAGEVVFPCISESCYFEYEECATMFTSGKGQLKIKGTLTGGETGDIYTVSGVENFNIQNQPSVVTIVFNVSIVNNAGMQVGAMHMLMHLTTNANGVVTVEKEETSIECF